jgi:AcrR family transcriptional regulator
VKPGRTGRRAGGQPTRELILAAARRRFAADGFAGTTIRAVGADAGVDPALVLHYFGTKAGLFAASVRLADFPDEVVGRIVDAPLEALGEAIARTFLAVTGSPGALDAWVGLIRSAVADGHAAAMLTQFLAEVVFEPLGRRLTAAGIEDAPLRVSLVASQVVGLGIARYVLCIEPLASTDGDDVVAAIGPGLQRYLTADLAIAER